MKANQDRSIEEEVAIDQAALQAFVDSVRPCPPSAPMAQI